MKINVIGATGMVGSRVVAEAANRGHDVTALSRSGAQVPGANQSETLDLSDTAAVDAAADLADATVIAVPSDRTGKSHEPLLQAHRDLIANPPASRVLIVGGAGSLEVDGGGLLKDTPDFPDAYKAEATTFTTVLNMYRNSDRIDWTLLSPAPAIAPGERTGSYQTSGDTPAGNSITAEDFAVAIVDELEQPKHRKARFTVAN